MFQMVKLDISANLLLNYEAADLSTCVHNIEELDVSYCHLKLGGIKFIVNEIKLRSKPVIYIIIIVIYNTIVI